MLQVKQVHLQDVDATLHNTVYKHSLNITLPESVLAKYYDGLALAQFVIEQGPLGYMYVLYEDSRPIGIFILFEDSPIHLNCTCLSDYLLFLVEDKRTLKNLLYLVKTSIELVKQHFYGNFMLFVGSTLGPSSLATFYQRLGFSYAGTNLVQELVGTKHL